MTTAPSKDSISRVIAQIEHTIFMYTGVLLPKIRQLPDWKSFTQNLHIGQDSEIVVPYDGEPFRFRWENKTQQLTVNKISSGGKQTQPLRESKKYNNSIFSKADSSTDESATYNLSQLLAD
jgi:hypothetical protein